MAQKVDTCGTDPGFFRGELQAMEAQTREESSYCRYMMDGTVVRAYLIVQIRADVVETGRNKSHDWNEPGRSAGSALGHAEPFVESIGDAEGCQGDSIRVDR